MGDDASAAPARRRRVAGGRPARAHLLLARRLLRAERRQHRAGRVLHARPARRRSASWRRARAASTTSRSPTTTTCAPPSDPGFGAYGVIGVPGYENSLHGHAQMLGATRIYDKGDGSAAAVNAIAERAARGRRRLPDQPSRRQTSTRAASTTAPTPATLDWSTATTCSPDTLEVWNLTSSIQLSPRPTGSAGSTRGAHVGATGGSDSHWLSTVAVQGVGNPTTWVFARDRSRAAVAARRSGRAHDDLAPAARAGRRAAAARGRPRRRRRVRVDRRRHGAARRADARGRSGRRAS